MEQPRHTLVAIVPCNDIGASSAFYERLRLSVFSDHGTYRILSDGKGWLLHLPAESPKGWVVPGRNPNGLYFYLEDVEGLAARLTDLRPAGVRTTSRGVCMSLLSPIPTARSSASAVQVG